MLGQRDGHRLLKEKSHFLVFRVCRICRIWVEFDAIICKGLLRNPKDVTVGVLVGGTPDRTTIDKV